MAAEGKKVIVLVEDYYQEMELWYPYYRLIEAGAEPVIVGPVAGKEYHSKLNYPCISQAAAADVNLDDFAGVVIPGGYSPDLMRRNKDMVNIVKNCAENGKVVGAICHAGWMLCSAEILEGKTVTSFFAIKDDLIHAGATWVDKEVVVDGKLITSRTPNDLPIFMKTVVENL